MKSRQQWLRHLVDDNPDGLLVLGPRGQIWFANPAALHLFGRASEELLGAPFGIPVGVAETGEVEIVRPDGEKRLAEMRVAEIEHQGRNVRILALRDMTDRRRIERDVRMSRARLRNLAERLHSVREEERTAIAREIHDQLGQALTALKMDLAWFLEKLPCPEGPARERASSMEALVGSTLDIVRRLSAQLRPAILDDLGLEAAIEWQVQEFAKRTECECILDLDASELEPQKRRDTVVFRILQESLTNIARHAEASRVEVSLRKRERRLLMIVRDDGRGITQEQVGDPRSLGVIGMRERAGSLGGRVYLERSSNGGTEMTLNLPLTPDPSLPDESP
ncbi:MAG: PAS domain S-box protein [Gammaproteobacteria bacterium]|nr:PAS domain S-box protein [Gammaproteobacteria bacterium]NIR81813.1 PAS domain S-box protein [Gammaproteobacteria bacterium]NIR88645.1 PAS domain S-box protein [Gammaproteobacteria bacterium]NIU02921.1 PAS domain S-box protein [Gammaproteobacteria bacterium]NIV50442.1 PAS domain S-box protein [Gammaproteobacteria bacterium]